MVEKNKDVKDQVVAGQGEQAQPTTEQGVEGQVAADGSTAGGQQTTKQDEQQVPLSRFQEVNNQRKNAEEQVQQARDQLALMQANQQPQPQQKDIYEQLGLEPYDSPTVEQQRQIDVYKAQQTKLQQTANASIQFAQSHPDFGTAVGQANPVTGQFMVSAELQKILMEKPYLQASCNTAQGAYNIVMQERKLAELSQKNTTMQQQQTQQNVDSNLAPMSTAAAGGSAVSREAGTITAKSTAEEVRAQQAKVQAGEFG